MCRIKRTGLRSRDENGYRKQCHECYSELIGAFSQCGDVVSAEAWLQDYASVSPSIRPAAAAVNFVICAYVKRWDMVSAEAWVNHMPAMGIDPDQATYNAIVEAHTAARNIEKAMEWFRRMRAAGMRPPAECYKAVIAMSAATEDSQAQGLPPTPPPAVTTKAAAGSWTPLPPPPPVKREEKEDCQQPSQSPPPPVERKETEGWTTVERKERKESVERREACQQQLSPPQPVVPPPPKDPPQPQQTQQQRTEWATPVGTWAGNKGEGYEVWATGPTSFSCMRTGQNASTKEFTLWYDQRGDCYWWGTSKKFFFDASQLLTDRIIWYPGDDSQRRRVAFSWNKAKNSAICVPSFSAAPAKAINTNRWGPKAQYAGA